MKKLFKSLFGVMLMSFAFAGCSNSQEDPEPAIDPSTITEYYPDFSGDLEKMNINYAKRKNECGFVMWWSKAKVIDPTHFLLITPLSEYSKFYNKAVNGSVLDMLFMENMYFDDGAFPDALKLTTEDYDYKQVYIHIDKPASVSNEEYPNVLKNAFKTIRETLPEADIVITTFDDSETSFIEGLNEENVAVLQTRDPEQDIISSMNSCTKTVTHHERENDTFNSKKRESIEWSKFHFTNARTIDNNNKRVLHSGASVMEGSYPFIKSNAPEYNIDYYVTSRGFNDVAFKKELEFVFRQYDYDAISFGATSHIKGQNETQSYASAKDSIDFIKTAEKNSKLLLANSTPRGTTADLTHFSDAESTEIIAMSRALKRLATEYNLSFEDLYQFAIDSRLVRKDAIHYDSNGYSKIGQELAYFFKKNLRK